MTQEEIMTVFKENDAFLEGHFVLSSGLHSPNYMQCAKVLKNPQATELLCKALAEKVKEYNPTIVIAPALGGVLVSYEVARALNLHGIFTERKEGKMLLRRGFVLTDKDRVLIVEDIITTGKSTKEVMEVVKAHGATIVAIACIGDRTEGKVDFGVPFKALVEVSIPVFDEKECPLCEKGIKVDKPGSRTKE